MDSWISREYRCLCGKLIFKGMILEGFLEFKCRHCDRITIVEGIVNRKNFNTVILNSNYQIINISDSAIDLLGYLKSDLIGKGIETIGTINKDLNQKIFEKIKLAGSILYKTSYRKKSKELIPVNTKAIFFRQKGKEYILIIFNPIKVSEFSKSKRGNEDDYGDVTMHLDTLGNINFVEMTEEAVDILKYSEDDIIQRNIFDFFSEEDKSEKIRHFKEAAIEEKSIRVTNKILTKDGKEVIVDSYLIPHYDNFGIFCGFESSGWISKE
ncbi:MAG: PAS domain-containing protein [Candidatus Paceibacterota bacterium]